MNRTTNFSNTRQQAAATTLALSLTLGMLLSINLLATQPADEAQMAATAASGAQAAQQLQRAPRG